MSAASHHLDPALAPAVVLAGLPVAVRRLVAAVQTLYAGDWDDCAEDLRRRRAGKPYLFRINPALGGDDELAWLHRLRAYELARGERFGTPDLDDPRPAPGSAPTGEDHQ
jgi:hypothetical protein